MNVELKSKSSKMKPQLYRNSIYKDYPWTCEGKTVKTIGATPEEAYKVWEKYEPKPRKIWDIFLNMFS